MSDDYSIEPYYVVGIVALSFILAILLVYYCGRCLWRCFLLRERRRVHPLLEDGEHQKAHPNISRAVFQAARSSSKKSRGTPGMTVLDVSDSET
jgi:hypothetical protein